MFALDGSARTGCITRRRSGNDDDMEEDAAEAIIAAEVDPDVQNELQAAVNPAAKREADIMAGLLRRPAARCPMRQSKAMDI